jgi:hypothetical protein
MAAGVVVGPGQATLAPVGEAPRELRRQQKLPERLPRRYVGIIPLCDVSLGQFSPTPSRQEHQPTAGSEQGRQARTRYGTRHAEGVGQG